MTPLVGLPTRTVILTPSLTENDTSEGLRAWSDPSNATHASNYASVNLGAGETSNNLHCWDCDFSVIPTNFRPVGVKVNYDRTADLGLSGNSRAQLMRNGAPPGLINPISILWLITVGQFTFGNTDSDWNIKMRTEEVQHSTFGVKIAVTNEAPALSTMFYIRNLEIELSYQLPQMGGTVL